MFILLRLVGDIISIILSFVFAYNIRFSVLNLTSITAFPYLQYKGYLLYFIVIYISLFLAFGMYKVRRGIFIELDELINGLMAVSCGSLLLILPTFIYNEYGYSRRIIVIGWIILFILVSLYRQIVLRIEIWARAKGLGSKRALVVGSGDFAKSLADKMREHPSYGIKFVGFVSNDPQNGSLGRPEEIEKLIGRYKIDSLFVADASFTRDKLTELADLCDQKNVTLGTFPDIFQILTTSPTAEEIEGFPTIAFKRIKLTPAKRVVKRAFDIFLALIGVIVFAVPMIIIALIIKTSSPGGPVIYVQKRVGRRSVLFRLYKFRTMIPNAEKVTGPVLASDDDPRQTPFGKFLRTTHLDELPQLFNILKGDMSFVGPRPERPVFVRKFKEIIPGYMERHKIRPAIAGWAQLQGGGYEMPPEEKLKYDLYYIENWSFMLDIKIILKCIQIAFTKN